MQNDTETWGLPFALEDLEAALSYSSEANLPLQISPHHKGAPEVIEIEPRDNGFNASWFSIYQDAHKPSMYAVTEGERLRYFGDLIEALKFCKAQRGEDWPTD